MTYPPEPWALAGRMDASTFLVPPAALPAISYPAGHRALAVAGRVPVVAAWVDYAPGGQLSYRELLVAVIARGRRALRPHVVSIWVDSAVSREGGRELWGTPKELARLDGDGWAGASGATGDVAGASAARGSAGELACTPEGARRPVARAVVGRHRRWPGRPTVRFAVAQNRLGGAVEQAGPAALVSPVSARSGVGRAVLRWEFDVDGELGFLAGRRPVTSVTLHDFAMSFGATARDRARS